MLQKNLVIAATLVLSLFATTASKAQNTLNLHCGTSEMLNKKLDENPQFKQDFLKEQGRLEEVDRVAAANGYHETEKMLATVYIIPVVFHVIEEGGTENISDAQIYDEIRILNRDYRKLNPDTSIIVPSFVSLASDIQIEFRLAKKDPNGACTNGIDRVFSSLTNNADDNSKLNDWPHNKYLNIWTIKNFDPTTLSGVAAYATFPGTPPSYADGVIVLSNYVGSIGTSSTFNSRVLTHEIGHFFNLQHPWGNTNSPGVACGNDGVTDTPITMGHTSCNLTDQTCTAGVTENTQNYMDYSYCTCMFTAGQRTRMRSAATSATGARNNLWNATNLSVTGVTTASVLCQADFTTNSTSSNVLCQGDSITFIDNTWNGNPTSWNWTFPGGTPASSTDSMPVVHYNTPGYYNVTLTAANASGSVNTTKSSYIRVNSSIASYTGTFYSEGFETSAIPNADWQVNNYTPGGNTWTQTSVAHVSGGKSAMITNTAAMDGSIDELISPSIDMTAIAGTSPTLSFKVAYAQRTTTSNDKLQVYVSTTCGKSWTLRLNYSGTSLATGGVTTANFVPGATQWAQKSTNLIGFASQPDLYIMFRFSSNGGNNIYIDDINLSGTVAAGIDEFSNAINFNVFPNPADENTQVNFNLITPEKTSVKVYDVVGREVADIYSGDLNAGEHSFLITDKAKLSSGVYMVTLSTGGHRFTKKLIVK